MVILSIGIYFCNPVIANNSYKPFRQNSDFVAIYIRIHWHLQIISIEFYVFSYCKCYAITCFNKYNAIRFHRILWSFVKSANYIHFRILYMYTI